MTGDGRYPETDPEQDGDAGDRDSPSAASMADRAAGDDADTPAGQTEPPFSVAFGGDPAPTDSDDDGGSGGDGDRVSPASPADPHDGDDLSGVAGATDNGPGGRDGPDPGYAAFADELDDPLADWPAPDTPLDSLPEMRNRRDADSVVAQRDAFDDDPFRATAPRAGQSGQQSAPPADDFPEAAYSDDPLENDATGVYADLPAQASGPRVDRDEPASPAPDVREHASRRMVGFNAGSNDVNRESPPADARPAAPVLPPERPATDDSGEQAVPYRDDLPPAADSDRDTADAIDRAVQADDSEAFVDDFLNDLDDLDDLDDADRVDSVPLAARETAADAADAAGFATQGPPGRVGAQDAASSAYRSEQNGGDDDGSEIPVVGRGGSDGAPGGMEQDTGIPWGMIAVVAVALLLLAAGGFGVVQQRSSLEAEIRDLQAQLATAVAPEEAAAGREQQRRLELENGALSAEVAALRDENESLADRLSSLEAQLEEQLAARASAAREARAAAETSARQAAGTAVAPTAPDDGAADPSGWFVNFGSYAQQTIARGWADRLEVSSGRVVVQEARASGQTLYRVRVVGLPDREAAERIATTLERQHQLPRLWVGRN